MQEALGPWLLPVGALVVFVMLGWLARAVLLGWLGRLTRRTRTDLDDFFLAATRRHVPLWFLAGGVSVAAQIAPIDGRHADLVGNVCAGAFVLSLAVATSRFATAALDRYTRLAGGVGKTSLIHHLVRLMILGLGGLLVLSNLGISITPLLTALGVGSLAVALALQPTLSNLFAGMHISLARPIRVGDFVELEGGTKGFVEDIGWRATQIRELPNNLIVVPNARLAEMILINYSLPVPQQAALVQVGVAYGSDLAKVERAACEVAREVLREVQGGVPEFDPFIRYHTFGDSSINFTVILQVREFTDRYLVTHEFMKRLKARFDSEGIEIPFPQRVVHAAAGSAAGRPQARAAGERA